MARGLSVPRVKAGGAATEAGTSMAPSIALLDDEFTSNKPAGSVNGSGSIPGLAHRQTYDTQGVIQVVDGWTRGYQVDAGPDYANQQTILINKFNDAYTPQAGRCLAALFRVADQDNELAFGVRSDAAQTTPLNKGYGILNDRGRLAAIVPASGAAVLFAEYPGNKYMIRPMDTLGVIAMNNGGAYYMLSTFADDATPGAGNTFTFGVPKYPLALVYYATRQTLTPAKAYPYIAGYLNRTSPNYYRGHGVDSLRLVDVPAWQVDDPIADYADRFERADSALLPGGGWVPVVGTWGIRHVGTNGALYPAAGGAGVRWCRHATSIADGVFVFNVVTPAVWNDFFLLIRINDPASNKYIRLKVTQTTGQIEWNDGAVPTIIGAGWTWAGLIGAQLSLSTAYEFVIQACSNQYWVSCNGSGIGSMRTDAGNHYLTSTGVGVAQATVGANAFNVLDVQAIPQYITLPDEIASSGRVPFTGAGTALVSSDTFIGALGTDLNGHVDDQGHTWTVAEGNGKYTFDGTGKVVALATANPNDQYHAFIDIGAGDFELAFDLNIGGVWGPMPKLCLGIMFKYAAINDLMAIRSRRDHNQPDHEAEDLLQIPAVIQEVNGKTYLGNFYQNNTTYRFVVRVKGDRAICLIDGKARHSMIVPARFNTFTKVGVYNWGDDDTAGPQTSFSNWSVRRL